MLSTRFSAFSIRLLLKKSRRHNTKSFPEVARNLTILKKEDVNKLHAMVPRGLVHLRQQELIPRGNLLKQAGGMKVRGQGDQPRASRALEDGAQVRRFKLALGRLIQGPTDIPFAPKKKSH